MEKILLNIVKVILLTIIISAIANISKADTTTKISLKADKTSLSKGEEFTLDIYVSNIDLDQGIMSVSGKISYNSKVLEPITSNDTTYNGWTISWNTSNGVILIDRGNGTSSEQSIAKLKFKVKENASVNEDTILFSNISVYNSEEEQECSDTSLKIALKTEGSSTDDNKKPNEGEETPKEENPPQEIPPQEQPKEQEPQQPQEQTQQKPNTQTPQTNSKLTNNKGTETPTKSSTSNEEIPYLGASEWIIGAIVVMAIIGIIAFRGYKKYNNV